MDASAALIEQYRAAVAMLVDCLEKCPDDLWATPCPRSQHGDCVIFRPFWRIALHALFYTHLYLPQSIDDFTPWPGRPPRDERLWLVELEPYELPEDAEPYTKDDLLSYAAYLDSILAPTIESLDLSSPSTGIPWYPNMTKLSHELLTLRHLQGHIGQLSELLMQRDIDPDWISRPSSS
jgi:hypothetical protein